MICAPLLITTLNRDIHFIRLIESLKKNSWAKYTPVYIALDYPPSAKYIDGYNKISKYLEGDFSMFMEFNVYRRKENYGSARNMLELREEVLRKYDRFIRTDDDAEFSPNFLEYMNKCLDKYECDSNVIAVSGYSYPVKWNVSENATVLKENFICPMWGTGFWRDRYKNIYNYIDIEGGLAKDARMTILNGGLGRMTDICRKEFAELCLSPDFKETLAAKVTDISVRMYMAIKNKYVIMPTISKVRNWGFDGSGEYCGMSVDNGKQVNAKNYPYQLQQIDESNGFWLRKDSLCNVYANRKQMNDFDIIPVKDQIKTYIKLILYYLLGDSNYKGLIMLYRRFK